MGKKLYKIVKEIGFKMNTIGNMLRFVNSIRDIDWNKIPQTIHKKFRNLIATLIYEKNWCWLEYLISLLATI